MGLLDDAIREHLDLKRRRGADPAEVERAEQEALGPVRRNRDPGETADSQDEISATGGLAYDQDDDEAWPEAGPAGGDLAEPPADYEDDELEFDPIVPPEPAERGSVRPRSLREPEDDEAPAQRDAPRRPFDEAGAAPPEAVPAPPEAASPAGDWSAAEEGFDAEPFPTTSGSPRRPADAAGPETSEYHIEDALSDAEAPEDGGDEERGDDMLEETPEFLQDTPDHDRLWFEQRPPRDFDFDG